MKFLEKAKETLSIILCDFLLLSTYKVGFSMSPGQRGTYREREESRQSQRWVTRVPKLIPSSSAIQATEY